MEGAASSAARIASALPISGCVAPARTASAIGERTNSVRLPAATWPSAESFSITSSARTTRSNASPARKRLAASTPPTASNATARPAAARYRATSSPRTRRVAIEDMPVIVSAMVSPLRIRLSIEGRDERCHVRRNALHCAWGGCLVMAPKDTLATQVREALADDILTGRMPAGTRLDEVSLARRFSVSRTPVREALRELTAAGLLDTRAHSGAAVAELATARIADMFEALHHHCGELVKRGDAELYHAANADFHAALRAGCHNAALEDAMETLRR